MTNECLAGWSSGFPPVPESSSSSLPLWYSLMPQGTKECFSLLVVSPLDQLPAAEPASLVVDMVQMVQNEFVQCLLCCCPLQSDLCPSTCPRLCLWTRSGRGTRWCCLADATGLRTVSRGTTRPSWCRTGTGRPTCGRCSTTCTRSCRGSRSTTASTSCSRSDSLNLV